MKNSLQMVIVNEWPGDMPDPEEFDEEDDTQERILPDEDDDYEDNELIGEDEDDFIGEEE